MSRRRLGLKGNAYSNLSVNGAALIRGNMVLYVIYIVYNV